MRPAVVATMYALLATVAAVQAILLATHNYNGQTYTEYNNYVIFKYSWYHLLGGKNMYILHPSEYFDLYKYSPTFSLAMGLLASMPDWLGLLLWDMLNALVLVWAVRLLPLPGRRQTMILWFCLLELLTSMQNSQSNGLMAGLMIAAYGHLYRGKHMWAALWLVVATFVKVYGAVGFAMFLFFPGKPRFIVWAAIWAILLAILPLAVTAPATLVWQYHNWAAMMAQDESASYGMSVMGWLHSWFGLVEGKRLVSLIGIILFLIPFARIALWRDKLYQLLILASMLLWVIIFNHKAESPTFVIAVAGAAIWYYAQPSVRWHLWLILFVFIFTSVGTTDIFPPPLRKSFMLPYTIKALPCIVLWVVVWAQLMTLKPGRAIAGGMATNTVNG